MRPRYSSGTFSCSSTYPETQVAPQKKPSTTVSTAASERFGMEARTKSVAAAASSDQENTWSISVARAARLTVAIPTPMPTPNAVTRTPQPALPAPRVLVANTGPSASTAPTALKATTIPVVIARARGCSRRNRRPSTMSRPIIERSTRAPRRAAGVRIGIPVSITAENRNVPASAQSASASGRAPR